MTIEHELKTDTFQSETQKAELNIMFTASWLKTLHNQRLKKFDLTNEQFNVLRIIRGQHPTPLCVRLVRRTASTKDRREVCITLAKLGEKILAKIDAAFGISQLNVSVLSLTEAQLLNALLDKMRNNASNDGL
jgi:hypothetical protein